MSERDSCVVIATGVRADGSRELLRFAVGDSEDGAFWTQFVRSPKARGLGGVQLVISDAHTGLKQAISAVLLGAAWQRSSFARGARTGVLAIWTSMVANTASKAAVNLLSRSRMRNPNRRWKSSRSMIMLRGRLRGSREAMYQPGSRSGLDRYRGM